MIWRWKDDESNYFLNANGSRVWEEYNQNESYATYRLYKIDSLNQVILENRKSRFYVILSESYVKYIDGEIYDDRARQTTIDGSWETAPNFPDR